VSIFTDPVSWCDKAVGSNTRFYVMVILVILIASIEFLTPEKSNAAFFLLVFSVLHLYALKQLLAKYRYLEKMYQEEIKNRNIKVK